MNKRNGVSAAVSVLTALAVCLMPVRVFADTTTTAAETTTAESETTTTTATDLTTELTTTTTETVTYTTAEPHQPVFTDPTTRITYEVLPDGTLRLTEFRWESDELEVQIPAQIGGKDITVIGERAFLYCYADTVNLPETVTKIEARAFAGCAYLNRMSIPPQCAEIGEAAFQGCERLTAVLMSDSVKQIGWQAFDGTPFSDNLSEPLLILGDGILYAYRGSETSLTLPASVKVIGAHAFDGNGTLRSIVLPDSVTRIQSGAFSGCTALTEIQPPAVLTELAPDALTDTAWYRNAKDDYLTLGDILVKYRGSGTVAEVPDGVRVIADGAFTDNAAVTTVRLPDSVQEIRASAFANCTSLQVAELGDSITEIGSSAFSGCGTLKYLRLGHQLQRLGADCFLGCPYLEEVYLPDTLTEIQPHALGYSANYDLIRNSLVIYSNTEAARLYAEAAGIQHEPLPDVENTEPPPAVTTVRGQEAGTGAPSGTAWIPAVILGGALVLIGGITAARRRKAAK
ncbi:MAG: leucine-rich repeat domain-containing protein [Oscillospiraceae bacterium]|nr:leucine-rich repeat domain-containing protein [Oscillospiraceae bacterium]